MSFDLNLRLQQTFQRHAAHYAEAAVVVDAIGDALLERLSFIRLQPKRILDLGSRHGYVSAQLRQRFPDSQVIAIEACHTLNRTAQVKHPHTIACVTADAYHLPLADNSIDLLIGHLLLPALLDYPALWQECQRVLAPGGLLLFSNIGPDTLQELRHSFATVDDYPHINTFIDMHDIGDSLVEAAFLDPVLDAERFEVSYPSLKALLHELKALASIKCLDDPTPPYFGKNFWQRVEHAYQQQFGDAKGRLPVTLDAYFGHAFKPLTQASRLDADGQVAIPISQIKRLARP
jgi:malonyl-CoA O-methyltransferase